MMKVVWLLPTAVALLAIGLPSLARAQTQGTIVEYKPGMPNPFAIQPYEAPTPGDNGYWAGTGSSKNQVGKPYASLAMIYKPKDAKSEMFKPKWEVAVKFLKLLSPYLRLVQVNIDQNPDVVQMLAVKAKPTLKLSMGESVETTTIPIKFAGPNLKPTGIESPSVEDLIEKVTDKMPQWVGMARRVDSGDELINVVNTTLTRPRLLFIHPEGGSLSAEGPAKLTRILSIAVRAKMGAKNSPVIIETTRTTVKDTGILNFLLKDDKTSFWTLAYLPPRPKSEEEQLWKKKKTWSTFVPASNTIYACWRWFEDPDQAEVVEEIEEPQVDAWDTHYDGAFISELAQAVYDSFMLVKPLWTKWFSETRSEALEDWVELLAESFPGEANRKSFQALADTLEKFEESEDTLDMKQWRKERNQFVIGDIKNDPSNWKSCLATTDDKPTNCGMWMLIHTITVAEAAKNPERKSGKVLKPIRGFVEQFLPCQHCAEHFLNNTQNYKKEAKLAKDLPMFLWKVHNMVNREKGHRGPWPTPEQCPDCYPPRPIVDWDSVNWIESEVEKFLKDQYGEKTLVLKRDTFVKEEAKKRADMWTHIKGASRNTSPLYALLTVSVLFVIVLVSVTGMEIERLFTKLFNPKP